MKKYFLHKKENGYILLLSMLMISLMSLIVTSILIKVYSTKNLIKTLSIRHNDHLILSNAVNFAQAFLNEEGSEDKSSDNSDNKENDHSEKEKKIVLSLYKNIWTNFYKWISYDFNEDTDFFDAKIVFYFMCEDGKIPIYQMILNVINLVKKKEKAEDNKSENNKSEENVSVEKKDEVKNNPKEDNLIKEYDDFFKKINEKSSALKSFKKPVSEEDKKENKEDGLFKKIFNKYKSYNTELESESLWNLFGSNANEVLVYNVLNAQNNEKIENKVIEEKKDLNNSYKIGDLLSIYNDKCSIFYINPAFMEILTKSEKFILNDEIRKKIIEAGQKIINNNDFNFKNIWNDLYKKTCSLDYPGENFKEIFKDDFFDNNKIPKYISVIIKINHLQSSFYSFVLFEKTASFGKNNREYLVKQLYLLKTI